MHILNNRAMKKLIFLIFYAKKVLDYLKQAGIKTPIF